MSEITSGEFTYGRTKNLGDYNNKKVELKLAFSVEKNDHAAALANVTRIAIESCEAILEGKAAPAFLQPATPKAAPTAAPAAGKTKADLAAEITGETAPAAPKPAAKKPPKVEKPAETKQKDAADLGDDDIMGAAVEEITDAILQDKITKRNQAIKNPQGIRGLIGQFVTHPKGARDIPQELRADFLAKLEALQPPAA